MKFQVVLFFSFYFLVGNLIAQQNNLSVENNSYNNHSYQIINFKLTRTLGSLCSSVVNNFSAKVQKTTNGLVFSSENFSFEFHSTTNNWNNPYRYVTNVYRYDETATASNNLRSGFSYAFATNEANGLIKEGVIRQRVFLDGNILCDYTWETWDDNLTCDNSDSGLSNVRVFHNSPDAPAVDVLIDNSKVLSNIAYPSNSNYLKVNSGTRNIKVAVAGTNTVAIEADLELKNSISYSVIALNKVANIEPLVLIDRTSSPDNSCAIRIVHGAPSAPAVDVYMTKFAADLSKAKPILSSVPFKGASDYIDIPCSNYQFRITVANTKTVAIDTGNVSITKGAYTAIARDNVGGGSPFGVTLVSDNIN
jgi:hypothetical protein